MSFPFGRLFGIWTFDVWHVTPWVDIMNDSLSVTQVIQLILAPAVMINATGLLLLTVSNKYSTILNRIRQLNEEKRRLTRKAGEPGYTTLENQRMESLLKQIVSLQDRASLMRKANVSYFTAIGIFVGVSLFLGIDLMLVAIDLQPLLLGFFLAGMFVDLMGVVYSALDAVKAFRVVRFEVAADE